MKFISLLLATVLAATVSAQEQIVMNWFIPAEDSFPPMTANVGDTIVFNWAGFHDVQIHPSGDCTEGGSILVGSQSGASYTFTEADVGDVLFVCDVGAHCEVGMRVTVTVSGAAQMTSAPSMAPTNRRNFPNFCFSGKGLVETEQKGTVEMADLKLGDKVLVSGNKYEQIYSFGHRNQDAVGHYLQVHSRDVKLPLEMSPDHMVQLEGGSFVPASHLEVGSKLVQHDGSSTVVEDIREVESRGVYAPFTESGTIVVNGIVASTFVAFQNSAHVKLGESVELPISFQWMAHAFESFHRLAWRAVGGSGYWSLETYTNDGVSRWVDLPHRFAEWVWVQHPFVIVSIMTPVCALLGTVYALESFTFVAFSLVLVTMMMARGFEMKKKQKIA